MIWPAIRRFIAVAFAFFVAVLAGLIVLFAVGMHWAAREVVSYAPENADEIARFIHEALGAAAFVVTVSPALTLLPALLVVVAGEVAHIRSWLYYVAAGGAAAAVMPLFSPPPGAESGVYAAPIFAIMATAGFAAGLIYWLIAGRRA